MSGRKPVPGGIFAAAVTPRRPREQSIDLAGTLELIDFLYEGGVNGIALLGSTGEFVHFVPEDRSRMLDFAVRRSRLPVLANVSHSTLDGAILLGQEAAASGVAGVLIMPPYYFQYDCDAIRSFFLSFGEAIASEVPVYLYNIPRFSNELALGTALDLLSTGLFAGIKDSSGNPEYLRGLLELRERRSFQVFAGDDGVFAAARASGADGGISGIASALPELLVSLNRSIEAGERGITERLEKRLHEFIDCMARFPVPVGIKEAARLRGVKTGALGVPLGAAGERELKQFADWYKSWLPGVLKECRSSLKECRA